MLATRMSGKTAAETISSMMVILRRLDPSLHGSVTLDNDTTFARHGLLTDLFGMSAWFCDAYDSWQKGGIENANGRLRRWLPRWLGIDAIDGAHLQDAIITLNTTPRKCLGFITLSRHSSRNLAKTFESASHENAALRAGIHPAGLPAPSAASASARRRRAPQPGSVRAARPGLRPVPRPCRGSALTPPPPVAGCRTDWRSRLPVWTSVRGVDPLSRMNDRDVAKADLPGRQLPTKPHTSRTVHALP